MTYCSALFYIVRHWKEVCVCSHAHSIPLPLSYWIFCMFAIHKLCISCLVFIFYVGNAWSHLIQLRISSEGWISWQRCIFWGASHRHVVYSTTCSLPLNWKEMANIVILYYNVSFCVLIINMKPSSHPRSSFCEQIWNKTAERQWGC